MKDVAFKVRDSFRVQVHRHFRDQVCSPVWYQVWEQVWEQVEGQVKEGLEL